MSNTNRAKAVFPILALSALTVILVYGFALDYEAKPGKNARIQKDFYNSAMNPDINSGTNATSNSAPEHLSMKESLSLSNDRYSLVMFIHPMCPCSRASLEQLERMLPRTRDNLEPIIVFSIRSSPSDSRARSQQVENNTDTESNSEYFRFQNSELIKQAKQIPGTRIQLDFDGVLAERLDAQTSGQIFLYAPNGDLRFSGGITPGRGHTGDSLAQNSIQQIIAGHSGTSSDAPVFGCPIGNLL